MIPHCDCITSNFLIEASERCLLKRSSETNSPKGDPNDHEKNFSQLIAATTIVMASLASAPAAMAHGAAAPVHGGVVQTAADLSFELLIRHGLLQSPDAVQLEPVEGLRHLSPSKVYE